MKIVVIQTNGFENFILNFSSRKSVQFHQNSNIVTFVEHPVELSQKEKEHPIDLFFLENSKGKCRTSGHPVWPVPNRPISILSPHLSVRTSHIFLPLSLSLTSRRRGLIPSRMASAAIRWKRRRGEQHLAARVSQAVVVRWGCHEGAAPRHDVAGAGTTRGCAKWARRAGREHRRFAWGAA